MAPAENKSTASNGKRKFIFVQSSLNSAGDILDYSLDRALDQPQRCHEHRLDLPLVVGRVPGVPAVDEYVIHNRDCLLDNQ